ncbi:MAG: sugar-binding protein [Hydrogenothermaceae bacterium]
MVFFRIVLVMVLSIFTFSNAQIKVKPAEVNYLEVDYNNTLVAGEEYTLKLKAKDKFGNPSNNLGTAGSIKFLASGINLDRTVITSKDIVDGTFYLKLYPSKAGDYSIQAFLNDRPLVFKIKPTDDIHNSLKFKVINNKVDNAVISSSDYFLPGYDYSIKLFFYDKEGNPVTQKNHINQTLIITAENFYKELNVENIDGYEYNLTIKPYTITDFSITVIDSATQKKVAVKTVRPEIQSIGRFEIEIPYETEAGEPFKIRIKALDTDGRIIKVYDGIGKDVKLIPSGTGQLIPNIISREQFKDGVAEVDVMYTKSEVINIQVITVDNKEIKTVPIQTYHEAKQPVKEDQKTNPQEQPHGEQKKEVKKEEISQQKPLKTTLKLKFPLEVGYLSKLVQLNKDSTSITIKGIFGNRNPEYEIKKFENDISINNQKVGKISFYEDQHGNLIIVVKMNEEGFKITPELLEKNQIEIKVEKLQKR